jgi:23S rRNA G2069 N7-methylase RlmK/C1962 C5-methylase RlmI
MNIEADAYRLVNGVGDGLPGLDIDVYGSFGWIHQRSRFYSPFINDIAEFMSTKF